MRYRHLAGNIIVQTRSFKYQIRKKADCVQLTIRGYRWKRFLIASVWAMVWIVAPVEVLRSSWGFNPYSYSFLLLGAFFAFVGAWSAAESLLSYQLTLYPSELLIRTSFFGLSRSRVVSLSSIAGFGLGHFRHSSAWVLRLEARTLDGKGIWIGLAYGVPKQEVDIFLVDVEAQGFRLPDNVWGL